MTTANDNLEMRASGAAAEDGRRDSVITKDREPAARAGHRVSPHLIDLKPAADGGGQAVRDGAESAGRRGAGRLWSDPADLHDVRELTLTPRARGWRDFPPSEATSVGHAVALTVKHFFQEHPLADLTVLTVVHLLAVLAWKTLTLPGRLAVRAFTPRPEHPQPVAGALLPVLPLAAVRTESRRPLDVRLTLKKQAGWSKSLLGFAGIAILLILPIGFWGYIEQLRGQKSEIMTEGLRGVSMLKGAGLAAGERKFTEANAAFTEAGRSFANAKEKMGTLGNLVTSAAAVVPARSQLAAAGPLLAAGRELADGGAALAAALAAFDTKNEPAAKIGELRGRLTEALPHLLAAERSLAKIDPTKMPAEYAGQLTDAQNQLPKLNTLLRRAELAAGLLYDAVGATTTRRYLIVFENNAELRPTGGFIGSFALIDINAGKVKKVEIPGGGSYDLQGSLRPRLASPQPLRLINPNWEFQDANWYADFPSSARKISWFYEKSGGPTTDGVIAVTMSFMEKILEVIGPIEMPEYGKTITAQNFYLETQKEVEIDYDKELNQPKKFIADLAPKVMEKILDADQSTLLRLTEALNSSLAEKNVLFWFRDDGLESRARELGWAGEVKETDGDYLQVVHTNIAGQKTDLVMQENIDHSVQVLGDGTGLVTLTIKRTHTGKKNELFSGVRNVDYLRVFVPAGSTLVEAGGFEAPDPKLFKIPDPSRKNDPAIAEQDRNSTLDRASGTRITSESGKTVFGNWVMTDPGETSTVTLVYKLPAGAVKATDINSGGLSAFYNLLTGERPGRTLTYSLVFQKQPGANPPTLTTNIDFPRGYYLFWQSPERTADERGRWSHATTLDRDLIFAAAARTN